MILSSSSSSQLLWVYSFILLLTISLTTEHVECQDKGESPAPSIQPNWSTEMLVPGLTWDFYSKSCPDLKNIIRTHLEHVFLKDITQAAGLLRLHFHDCFVQGCEGSILLDGSAEAPGEKTSKPNFTIRKDTFEIIEELRRIIHLKCGPVVSCTDIIALGAREAVFLSKGPEYEIPLGRRDGVNHATERATMFQIPSPISHTFELLRKVQKFNMTATDLVALSGAHTIGRTQCMFMANRLYPEPDPTMGAASVEKLKKICPHVNSDAEVNLDQLTPHVFDNQYFVDLQTRHGIFTSDQDLYDDNTTKSIVDEFAKDQDLFFEKFVDGIVKMGQIGVLTGDQGEVRKICSVVNGGVVSNDTATAQI